MYLVHVNSAEVLKEHVLRMFDGGTRQISAFYAPFKREICTVFNIQLPMNHFNKEEEHHQYYILLSIFIESVKVYKFLIATGISRQ